MAVDAQTRNKTERRGELDVMGMVVVVGLVFFHSAQIFSGGDFYVTNESSSIAALVLVAFASMWGMPLMFLIAGIAIWHSLRKRSVGEFVRERIQGLLIPFIVSVPLLIPPQVYYGMKGDPSYNETYAQFFPRFFDINFDLNAFPLFISGALPEGLFRLSTLYFLFDLFIYTLLLLPLFLYVRNSPGRTLVNKVVNTLTRPGIFFLLSLPVGITEAAFGSDYPGRWNPLAWIPFIFYGFLFAGKKQFEAAVHRHWKSALILGILFFVGWFVILGLLFTTDEIDPFKDYDMASISMRFLRGFISWLWVIAIMGLVNRKTKAQTHSPLSSGSQRDTSPDPISQSPEATSKPTIMDRIGSYAKEAQLPFYIIHQTPIVVIGYYVVQWETSGFIKYIAITLSTLVVTLVLYDIFVKRTRLTRFIRG
jgi:hypothetical protein